MEYKFGKMAFISYRTRFHLVEGKCPRINLGKKCDNTTNFFEICNQEKCNYRKACYLVRSLQRGGFIDTAVLYPPEKILPSNALLMPYDYLELMGNLFDQLQKCNAFVRFDMDNSDNYWTLLEKTVWRAVSGNPTEYRMNSNADGYSSSGPFTLERMGEDERSLWWRIRKQMQFDHKHIVFWGDYARTCFLLNCPSCGEYFSVSRNAVNLFVNSGFQMPCPYCQKSSFTFVLQEDNIRTWPWLCNIESSSEKEQTPITPDAMLDLLLDDSKTCPKHIALICGRNENISSEAARVAKGMANWAIDNFVDSKLLRDVIKLTKEATKQITTDIEIRYRDKSGNVNIVH